MFNPLALFNLVGEGVKAFAAHKMAKVEAKRALELQALTQEGDWDNKMADASASSWKDEFWTIVLAFPLFVVFYAAMADKPELIARLQEAFLVLEQTPDWYKMALGAAIAAAFAVKRLLPMIGKKDG